MRVTWFTR